MMIGAVATALLELGSATALYANEFVLIPRLFRKQRIAYAFALLLMLTALTMSVVYAIQFVYDHLWGPDSRRLGFRTNFVSDLAWITVHLVLGSIIYRLARRSTSSESLA
jgi:hypothetical protein